MMITYAILTLVAIYSLFLFYKMIRTVSLQTTASSERNNKKFIRVVLSGLIGFVAMFGSEWLYLNLSERIKYLWNPYAGSPTILACLSAGSFGAVFGAIIGLFNYAAMPPKRKRDIYISVGLFLLMIILSGSLMLAISITIGYHMLALLLKRLLKKAKKSMI